MSADLPARIAELERERDIAVWHRQSLEQLGDAMAQCAEHGPLGIAALAHAVAEWRNIRAAQEEARAEFAAARALVGGAGGEEPCQMCGENWCDCDR